MAERYLGKNELAKALSVSPRTIDTWPAKKWIQVIATSPSLHLFDLEDVKQALKDRL
jgi:hypothetical protein